MTQPTATIDFSIPAMRLLERLPEHTRAEVIYGKLYILPVPSIYHARVVSRISGELYKHVQGHELGEVFFSPVGIYLLSGTNAVVPDIIYISKDNPHLTIDTRGVFGPTDLHIEVLSPNNKKHDLVRKKKLYEEFGVREYWIIDRFRRTLTVCIGKEKPRLVRAKEAYATALLPGFELPLSRLFEITDAWPR